MMSGKTMPDPARDSIGATGFFRPSSPFVAIRMFWPFIKLFPISRSAADRAEYWTIFPPSSLPAGFGGRSHTFCCSRTRRANSKRLSSYTRTALAGCPAVSSSLRTLMASRPFLLLSHYDPWLPGRLRSISWITGRIWFCFRCETATSLPYTPPHRATPEPAPALVLHGSALRIAASQ
jgi:hypothetical protein